MSTSHNTSGCSMRSFPFNIHATRTMMQTWGGGGQSKNYGTFHHKISKSLHDAKVIDKLNY